jgi:toxin ParE1/3/4
MRIAFTPQAKADVDELRAWLSPLSPAGLRNVTAAIERSIRFASEHPGIGRQTPREGIREIVEPRYGFVIPYAPVDDVLWVLRVYRSVRRPLDYATIDLPGEAT